MRYLFSSFSTKSALAATLLTPFFVIALTFAGCASSTNYQSKERALSNFIENHVEKVKPLQKQSNLAWWRAATTGEPQAYDRVSALSLKLKKIYSDPSDFGYIKYMKEKGNIEDPLLARQATVLYYDYLENQIDPNMLADLVELSTQIEKNFSTFRPQIDGEKVTDNRIKAILKTETANDKRKAAWLASKQVGKVVAEDIILLVQLRNQTARRLGFDNYHTMSLTTSEQNPAELNAIFAELYELTNEPYAELKAELDAILAEKYGITTEQLRPWHYHDPFFQETPLVYDLDLDSYYAEADVKELAREFFAGIGLPVESILDDSDLYEREGKNPHAFCTDIDREGDVRILCNIKPTETWMETTLHELGHGVYDKFINPDLPYLLREPAHAFTTEGIAMFFGRLSRNPHWMQQMLDLSDEQRAEIQKVSDKYARLKQLIFARWAMVMYNFEKQLYTDPEQDLNALWWKMVEKYQMVTPPADRDEPDWAAKIHFAVAPCYYHNYMLGELFASQLHNFITNEVLRVESAKNVSYVNRPQAGKYLESAVFRPGDRYHWNEMIRRATGETLTPKYFVDQFVK